jgi:hypothetical protein
MTSTQRFLFTITALNVACAAVSVSVSLWPHAVAAGAQTVEVVRARQLEIVDVEGRVRASIVVHPADAANKDDSVVFRLVNPDGRPGVKLASSQNDVGLALIARQGDYLQVFGDGLKVTRDFKERAAWP